MSFPEGPSNPAPSSIDQHVNHWRISPMAHVQRFDHIGITVADLDSATAFFVGLGLEVEGTGSVEGEFVETVCGIPGAHCEIAMLRPPDGGSRLELSSFVTPDHVPGSPAAMANELGLRNVSFEVGDSTRLSVRSPRTGMSSSAESASTSTACGWPMCVDLRESSCPCSSRSAEV